MCTQVIILSCVLFFVAVNHVTSLETYSPEELQALKQFRYAAKDLLKTEYERGDAYTIHWLRAKNLDVQAAKKMLAKSKLWRKEHGIDGILGNKDVINMMKRYPTMYGTTKAKDGKAGCLFNLAQWDFRKGALVGDDWTKMIGYFFERMNTITRNSSESQWLHIANLAQFNLRQHACIACVPWYVEIVTIYENYFPNHLKEIIIFNAPSIFEPTSKLLKSLMTPLTKKVFQVIGHDKNEWQKELLKHFDATQLPTNFGGTKPITQIKI